MKKNQSLQIKLALDAGLRRTWQLLEKEYEALDRASIVRLALNNLVKETKKQQDFIEQELFRYFDEVEQRNEGMTEKEFFKWWKKNRPF